MNWPLALLAALLSALALYLPTRTQAFARVTVDGRGIRMLVAGRGDATVVFENGSGAPLEMWGKVQPAVGRFAKTVSYDRAGVGLSDDGPKPRDGRQVATGLRQALSAAGIVPPYILVGASLGGPYVRVFAGTYPADVASLVLVDPTVNSELISDVPAGIPVFLIDAISPVEVPFATAAVRAQRRTNRPEIEADSLDYRRWLNTIPDSHLIVTHRSGHNVPLEQPEIVVATIREAVAAARRR